MINNIKNILVNSKNIDGWRVVETKTESSELFFVKKGLDMNRAKNVHHFKVTVYKDFEENNTKFKGSSTTNIHPSMDNDEIEKAINDAAFASQFVKNKFYPLVKSHNSNQPIIESVFSKAPISNYLSDLTAAIYKGDTYDKGCINSSELFLDKVYTRIITSEGIDVNWNGYKGELEFITNWKEDSEEIELYENVKFADFKPEVLTEKVKEMLYRSQNKAITTSTPSIKNTAVLLTGSPAEELLNYYYSQSNAQQVYEQISTAKVNENVQGNDVKGDLVNLKLDPFLENSTESRPYDASGFPLKTVSIFENGNLLRYWGDVRYSHYLNIEPTGHIGNLIFEGGSKSIEDMKQEAYLELTDFSDFQLDPLTGDFAGEIRLGWYHNGDTIVSVSGGSISGNIKEVQKHMYLSKELQYNNNFVGPKTMQFFDVAIAGV